MAVCPDKFHSADDDAVQ